MKEKHVLQNSMNTLQLNKESSVLPRRKIDFLRGVAIFLMLWGHCIQYLCYKQFALYENMAFKIIYSFHMPLFMIISGYLFYISAAKRDLTSLISWKVQSIMHPLLMYSLIHLLLTKGVQYLCRGQLLERGGQLLGHLSLNGFWFLWSVLSCSLALSFAVKLTSRPYLQAFLIFFLGLLTLLFPYGQWSLWLYVYFVLGYMYARYKEKLDRFRNVAGILASFVWLVMLCFYRSEHSIYKAGLTGGDSLKEMIVIDVFRWIIGIAGAMAVGWMLILLFGVMKKTKIVRFAEHLGKDSIAIYMLSSSLLSFWLPNITEHIFQCGLNANWNDCIWFYNLVITPVVAIAYSILFLLIVYALKKTNAYSILFGR